MKFETFWNAFKANNPRPVETGMVHCSIETLRCLMEESYNIGKSTGKSEIIGNDIKRLAPLLNDTFYRNKL